MEIIIGAIVLLGGALALIAFTLFRLFAWPGEDDSSYEDDRFWGYQDIDDRLRRKREME
jgi:hypothetical protein